MYRVYIWNGAQLGAKQVEANQEVNDGLESTKKVTEEDDFRDLNFGAKESADASWKKKTIFT